MSESMIPRELTEYAAVGENSAIEFSRNLITSSCVNQQNSIPPVWAVGAIDDSLGSVCFRFELIVVLLVMGTTRF
ncbi:hypothetical protein HanRHA438_Chr05g0235291 [Helianthus annuus]|nr:hypothetical protein HanRHA438_Chr05g0235291 [Helianthus annuus]